MRRWIAGCATTMALTGLVACVPPGPGAPPPTTSEQEGRNCEIERRTIETALEAYRAEGSGYPETLQVLIGVYFAGAPTFDWEYSSDGATYTMTGPCD